MVEIKKSSEPKDFKERFEFKLTVGDNIICQRYFKINNFNPRSIRSYELAHTIRECANRIDADLKDKTQIYLSIYAPMIFDNISSMSKHFSEPFNCAKMHIGEGIIVKNESVDYIWNGKEPIRGTKKFDDGEFTKELVNEDKLQCKFSFLIDGNEVCSTVWDGIYPKYVRNSIDLSNKRGRLNSGEKQTASFETYLLNKMVEGKSDLVWIIIKNICYTCSQNSDSDFYTVENENYKNKLSWKFRYLQND